MKLALDTELVEWVEPFFATFGYTIVSVRYSSSPQR
jgi:hypothetical protein